MLESKWVSSSKDILTFRRALMNQVTSLQFRRYVSIKGDNYENDVLFWQEVQRYKVRLTRSPSHKYITWQCKILLSSFRKIPGTGYFKVSLTYLS